MWYDVVGYDDTTVYELYHEQVLYDAWGGTKSNANYAVPTVLCVCI